MICSRANFYRSRFKFRRLHPACCKPLPDQLIQTKLISCQRFFHRSRCPAKICRSNRLMGILNLFLRSFLLFSLCHKILSINFSDIFSCRCICLIRNSCGIRTEVCDNTNRTTAFDVNSLVQLLRNPHRLLRSKVQYLRRFLLQCTCRKRKWRFLQSLTYFHFIYKEFFVLNFTDNLIHLFFRMNGHFFLIFPVETCHKRLFLTFNMDRCIKCPVFFRNKCINFFFTISNDAKRHRLYSPCT